MFDGFQDRCNKPDSANHPNGALNLTRTGTEVIPTDFKSVMSTNSIIRALFVI